MDTMALCYNLLSQFATPHSIGRYFWVNKAGEVRDRLLCRTVLEIKWPSHSKCAGWLVASKNTEDRLNTSINRKAVVISGYLHMRVCRWGYLTSSAIERKQHPQQGQKLQSLLPSQKKMPKQSNNERGKSEYRCHSCAGNAGQINWFKTEGEEGRIKQGIRVL